MSKPKRMTCSGTCYDRCASSSCRHHKKGHSWSPGCMVSCTSSLGVHGAFCRPTKAKKAKRSRKFGNDTHPDHHTHRCENYDRCRLGPYDCPHYGPHAPIFECDTYARGCQRTDDGGIANSVCRPIEDIALNELVSLDQMRSPAAIAKIVAGYRSESDRKAKEIADLRGKLMSIRQSLWAIDDAIRTTLEEA